MTKYHPLYAYAILSTILILGIQMMLVHGPQGITGLAVGDQNMQQQGEQQGQFMAAPQGQQQGQFGQPEQMPSPSQKKGFFKRVGGFFGMQQMMPQKQTETVVSTTDEQTTEAAEQEAEKNMEVQQQGFIPPQPDKECLGAVDAEIKDCSKEAIQKCLDTDPTVDCVFSGMDSCFESHKAEKEACFPTIEEEPK